MRLDAATVHVRSIEGAEVIDVEAVAAPHEQGVVAGDRHVVEEDLGLRTATDCHPVARDVEGLARASTAGPDNERGALAADPVEVDGLELAGLADLVDLGGVAVALGGLAEKGTALLAVVRPLGVDEPALGTVHR